MAFSKATNTGWKPVPPASGLYFAVAAIVMLAACGAQVLATDILVGSAKEFQQAAKGAGPGDVLLLADGKWVDADLKLEASGAAEKPLTLRAQTPGKVVLTGKSRLRVTGSHVIVSGLRIEDSTVDSHIISFRGPSDDKPSTGCRLTDCSVTQSGTTVAPEKNSYFVSLFGTKHEVDHCYFKGKLTSGPTLVVWVEGRPNEHHIHHNYFAGRIPLGKNGGETMRLGTSDVSMNVGRAVVESNYFEHCDGEAEIISNKSCENVYRNNTFVECKGALTLRHGNRCTVEGNFFFGRGVDGTGGIRVIGEDHRIYNNYLDSLAGKDFESAFPIVDGIPNSKPNEYFQVKRALIAFNTIVNCRQSMTFGVGHGQRNRVEPAVDCTVANNLIVSREGPLVKFYSEPVNATWVGNVMYGAETGLASEAAGVVVADPQFAKGEGELLQPSASGPVADGAKGDFPEIDTDALGRPRDAKKDVGCFEVTSDAVPVRRPVTLADVGPTWMTK